MNTNILIIEEILKRTDKPFVVEQNKQFDMSKADLYAFRKAGMMGRDYVFIHDFSEQQIIDISMVFSLHEAARSYVNSFYKMPKILRFKVPNIVSFFMSSKGFSTEIILYANKNSKTVAGGEVHSVYLIDMESEKIYGQGKSSVNVDGIKFEFKNIDPQNRSFRLASEIEKMLFLK